MKRREILPAVAAVLFSAVTASAQFRATAYVPSAPPAILGASAVTAASAVPVLAAQLGVDALPAASILPISAVPAAETPAAMDVARGLTQALSAGSVDAEQALSAAFDGAMAAPGVAAGDTPPAAADPAADFALRAENLFTAGRLAPGQRAQVAWSDAVRPEGVLPTDQEMHDRMARSPLTNPEREAVVIELFKLAGAKAEDIVFQDAGRGKRNILLTKKGRTDRVIVVGAHHDKVREGAGTIDNWTGTTMMINLYQALRDVETDATIVFAAFAREEEGLIGSARFVEELSREKRAKVDAMVNLDTLAVNGTYSWKNNSTRALLDRIKAVAAASRRDLTEATLYGGDADSTSFRRAGIPALTVFGASEDVIFDIVHSGRDTMAAFNLEHYKNAYLLARDLIQALDREPLGPVGRGRS